MTNLESIDLSNSNSLDRAPLGWAFVPNEKLTIDLHGATRFSDLPFQLCASNTNLTKLDVKGTAAETKINWNGQLAANFSSFDAKTLSQTCLAAMKGLTTLSLAYNNLTLRWVFLTNDFFVFLLCADACAFFWVGVTRIDIDPFFSAMFDLRPANLMVPCCWNLIH